MLNCYRIIKFEKKNKGFFFCQLFPLEGWSICDYATFGYTQLINQYSFWGAGGVGEHCPNVSCRCAIPSEGRLALLEKLVMIQHGSNTF